ncbi:MAG: nucleotide-binding protein [Methanophagales archaeon]|nr:hypothetical protein [Methanophagales archaeon]MCW3137725.1 nucleotide-binding protein [Methanophagales archaeon]
MNPIKENAVKILTTLIEREVKEAQGKQIEQMTGLSPEDINDAVDYLEDLGSVEVIKWLGTAPYNFGAITVNSRGRYLYHEMKKRTDEVEKEKKLLPERPVNPVGSPYGFTDDDWEFVSLRREDRSTLNVVFGLQYKSEYYNTDQLISNIKKYFQKAVETYSEKPSKEKITLQFEKLTAGYGEHLFNTIARSIIGSDIAVFEVSDQNPNVMIELGVALTWGVRVLPLREKNSPKPPTDISGQTWIEYEESGGKIIDEEFHRKLEKMIERAISKKGR